MNQFYLKHDTNAVSITLDGNTIIDASYQGVFDMELIDELVDMVSLAVPEITSISHTDVVESSVLLEEFNSTSMNSIFMVRKNMKMTRVLFGFVDGLLSIDKVTNGDISQVATYLGDAVMSKEVAKSLGIEAVRKAGFTLATNDMYYKPDFS